MTACILNSAALSKTMQSLIILFWVSLLLTGYGVIGVSLRDRSRASLIPPGFKAEMLLKTPDGKKITQDLSSSSDTVCLTRGCVKIAASIIGYIDEKVNPCVDFYNFTCGGYIRRKIIPDEKSSITVMADITDSLQERMRIILEADDSRNYETRTSRMTKNFYKSCMNESRIEKEGLKPLQNILKSLGGWPVIEGKSWNGANFSWIGTVHKIDQLGFSEDILFSFNVAEDDKNSSWRSITLDQPYLGLEREYLINGAKDSDVQAYLRFSSGVAELLGAEPETAHREMEEMLLFEISLANISISREERRNFTRMYNVFSIQNLTEITPQVPWLQYLNGLLPSPVQIKNNERIIVYEPEFFRRFSELMRTVSNRTLANYLLWRVIKEAATYLSMDIRELEFELTQTLEGTKQMKPRWKECVKMVSEELDYGIGNLYVKNFFNEEAKDQMTSIVKYVRENFDSILNSLDWMDQETRSEALRKLSAMKSHIAYPKELLMDSKLDEYYRGLEIDDGSLLNNILKVEKFEANYYRGLLREKVDKNDWKLQGEAAVVNAYYASSENAIKFPAGILQGAFFEPDQPQYMNFGGIGHVIGHEIIHGFDDQGKQYDANGNLRNWWNDATEQRFLEKAKCVVDQYSNYVVPENGLNLNGINSQGEDIADNGGLNEAYGAYQNWVKDHGSEKSLPGLNYTSDQLFWISFGLKTCERARPESLKQQVLTGEHTPWRFRLIGPASNSEHFARAFKCPRGAPMNPVHKCGVW